MIETAFTLERAVKLFQPQTTTGCLHQIFVLKQITKIISFCEAHEHKKVTNCDFITS